MAIKRSTADKPASPSPVKLAEQVAHRIEERIFTKNLPIGHRLGNESELSAGLGVSRWPFREALSLLEASGLIELRRGVYGGIYVAARMLDVACNRLSHYLEFVHSDHVELTAVHAALRRGVLERAHGRLTAKKRKTLQALQEKTATPNAEGFDAITAAWNEMMDTVGNPALTLFTNTLATMLVHASWYSTLNDKSFFGLFAITSPANFEVIDLLLQGDLDGACAANEVVMKEFGRLFKASSATGRLPQRAGSTERAYEFYPPGRPAKKAEYVARELSEQISNSGWQEGMSLGGERELMERFGVGRAVIREAIRSLERLGAVSMGRGGASGLKVTSPNPVVIVEASRRHLQRENIRPRHITDLRPLLEELSGPNTRASRAAPGEYDTVVRLFNAILTPGLTA